MSLFRVGGETDGCHGLMGMAHQGLHTGGDGLCHEVYNGLAVESFARVDAYFVGILTDIDHAGQVAADVAVGQLPPVGIRCWMAGCQHHVLLNAFALEGKGRCGVEMAVATQMGGWIATVAMGGEEDAVQVLQKGEGWCVVGGADQQGQRLYEHAVGVAQLTAFAAVGKGEESN